MEQEMLSQVMNLTKTLSGIVAGIYILMIIFGGFKYVLAEGDPHQSESAKAQIVAAGVGIGISFFSFAILGIIKTASGLPEQSVSQPSALLIAIIIIVVIGILGVSVAFGGIMGEKEEELEEMKKEENTSEIKPVETEIVTLSMIKEAIHKKKVDSEMTDYYTFIIDGIEHLRDELEKLDIESRYTVEEALEKDAIHLYTLYESLNDEAKEDYYHEIMIGLSHMKNEIQDIYEKINQNEIKELKKKLVVIERKYAKK